MAEQVDYAKMVTDLKDNVPAFLVKMKVDAQLHRGKYLALLSQGFTEAQSLELCKQIY